MAEPSKQAKYPKQADTHTLNDKIWFQEDPDSTEWYAESNDMQLLRINNMQLLRQIHIHKVWSRCNQGEFALWFLFVTKNQPLQMGNKVWAPWENVMISACSFRGFRALPSGELLKELVCSAASRQPTVA